MYDRLIGLFTLEELDFLANKKILLVGVGGVGSFVFETLIRSGIKNIDIIDYDKYDISNLNRQLHSNLNVLEKNKVDVLKDYAKNINLEINVNGFNIFLDNSTDFNFSKYDYIIDACDSMEAKILLIKQARLNNIKIISSLSVGKRIDPNQLIITSLNNTFNDPLAKKFRKALKSENIDLNIKVLFSKELPLKGDKIFSYMPVVSIAGIKIADYVVKDLINEYRTNKK